MKNWYNKPRVGENTYSFRIGVLDCSDLRNLMIRHKVVGADGVVPPSLSFLAHHLLMDYLDYLRSLPVLSGTALPGSFLGFPDAGVIVDG